MDSGGGLASAFRLAKARCLFFSPGSLEVFVKVLNACQARGHRNVWVYGSGLADLPIGLTVRNDGTGELKQLPIPDAGVLRPQNGGLLDWCWSAFRS